MPLPLVLVVGAGPTGLTAAIELKRAGFAVRIIDKSDHPALYSQALVIQARTLEQLQRYGIADQAAQRGRKLTQVNFLSDRKPILSLELNRINSLYPYVLLLPQTQTEQLLNTCMESFGVETERNTELVSLIQNGNQTHAVLRRADGSSEEIRPRWVIGCDGAHSTVRKAAGIIFEGASIGIAFFLGDLELEGPDLPGDAITLHFHHGDVVFMGRISDRITRVIVASSRIADPQNFDFPRELTLNDFQRVIDAAGIKVRVRSAEWLTPFHVTDRQAQHYRIDNLFLAGDASHIHSPVGGQGMNTGIQDVANLVWKMAAVSRGADDSLLDSYEEERRAVGEALLRFTERGLKLVTASNTFVEALRDSFAPFLSKIDPVQEAAVAFISETAIAYRSSSIVADRGGDGGLRAGDRMPDLPVGTNGSSTTLLRNWTQARHLVIPYNADADELDGLKMRLPLADVYQLYSADLNQKGRKLLGRSKKLFILRPDGYIGFRGRLDKHDDWIGYAYQDRLAA
jgi:2-polyprenyl-6-methoxyphenol hydroxylase-like FAD-dependent oxidoreductase